MKENKLNKYIILIMILIVSMIVFYQTYKLVEGITSSIKYHSSYNVLYKESNYVGTYNYLNNSIILNSNQTFKMFIDNVEYKGIFEIKDNNLKLITYDKENKLDLIIENNVIKNLKINSVNENNLFIKE